MKTQHTPTPIQRLTSLTHDGKIGPRTIQFALTNEGSEDLKAYIVRAVNAHTGLVLACINALGVCRDAGLDDSDTVVKQIKQAIAKAEQKD